MNAHLLQHPRELGLPQRPAVALRTQALALSLQRAQLDCRDGRRGEREGEDESAPPLPPHRPLSLSRPRTEQVLLGSARLCKDALQLRVLSREPLRPRCPLRPQTSNLAACLRQRRFRCQPQRRLRRQLRREARDSAREVLRHLCVDGLRRGEG